MPLRCGEHLQQTTHAESEHHNEYPGGISQNVIAACWAEGETYLGKHLLQQLQVRLTIKCGMETEHGA